VTQEKNDRKPHHWVKKNQAGVQAGKKKKKVRNKGPGFVKSCQKQERDSKKKKQGGK